jgi:hypothetical protein
VRVQFGRDGVDDLEGKQSEAGRSGLCFPPYIDGVLGLAFAVCASMTSAAKAGNSVELQTQTQTACSARPVSYRLAPQSMSAT